LSNNRDTLHRIAVALLEREVLDANEIKLIIEGKALPTKQPPTPHDEGGVQQVLKPAPGGAQPGIVPGERPTPA
jgi:cell division protease FtsH